MMFLMMMVIFFEFRWCFELVACWCENLECKKRKKKGSCCVCVFLLYTLPFPPFPLMCVYISTGTGHPAGQAKNQPPTWLMQKHNIFQLAKIIMLLPLLPLPFLLKKGPFKKRHFKHYQRTTEVKLNKKKLIAMYFSFLLFFSDFCCTASYNCRATKTAIYRMKRKKKLKKIIGLLHFGLSSVLWFFHVSCNELCVVTFITKWEQGKFLNFLRLSCQIFR